jgi:hypothetical protein
VTTSDAAWREVQRDIAREPGFRIGAYSDLVNVRSEIIHMPGQRCQLESAVSRKLFRGWARSTPATRQRGNDYPAEIGEIGVGERGALCLGIQRTE